ncbi:MAG TPA: diguanylate cyclase, partial [Burkholderiaceae bacterium]|nr:diguanylate cyclase [Burkholderiaceae bacterium]
MSELLLSSSGGQPRQSLGARLTRAAVAAAGVALLVAGLILNVFMYFWLRNALEADVKVQSLVTADNVLAPLLFGDLRAARETLASLRAAPAIVSACLYDDKGRPFASYERSSGDVCDSLAVRQEVVLHGKHLHVASPVHQKEGGRTIGRVELVATLQPLMQRSLLFAGLTAIAGVAALGIAYLLAVGIRRDIDKTEARLDELAFVDPVTGLFNRRAAHEHLQSMVARGKPFGLMVLDLDDFKLVNDTLGHEAGDEVLRLLAKRLREGLRSTDLIFRLGGDEFIVVCDGHALEEGAERFGSVAIGALHKPLRIGINEIYARGSVGIAKFPDDAQDAQSLLRAADAAMYSAKAAGKNTFVVYRPEIGHETSSRLRIDTELRRAIGRGELVLYYQPIVDLRSGRAVGVEALVRWRHPERGLLPPSEF